MMASYVLRHRGQRKPEGERGGFSEVKRWKNDAKGKGFKELNHVRWVRLWSDASLNRRRASFVSNRQTKARVHAGRVLTHLQATGLYVVPKSW